MLYWYAMIVIISYINELFDCYEGIPVEFPSAKHFGPACQYAVRRQTHGGRPSIAPRIIVHECCALWVFPDCSAATFYLLRLKDSRNDGLKLKFTFVPSVGDCWGSYVAKWSKMYFSRPSLGPTEFGSDRWYYLRILLNKIPSYFIYLIFPSIFQVFYFIPP